MRYTALTTALIALMASLEANAWDLCPGAPESLLTTNRPYAGYKYADASWGTEKPVSERDRLARLKQEN
jgi:hypothetical protein